MCAPCTHFPTLCSPAPVATRLQQSSPLLPLPPSSNTIYPTTLFEHCSPLQTLQTAVFFYCSQLLWSFKKNKKQMSAPEKILLLLMFNKQTPYLGIQNCPHLDWFFPWGITMLTVGSLAASQPASHCAGDGRAVPCEWRHVPGGCGW